MAVYAGPDNVIASDPENPVLIGHRHGILRAARTDIAHAVPNEKGPEPQRQALQARRITPARISPVHVRSDTTMRYRYFARLSLLLVCCYTSFSLPAAVVHTGDTDLAIGDFAQIFLPGLGLSMALYQGDDEGVQQWWKSTGSTVLATQVLKQAFASSSIGTRPNGGTRSFPSGHTAGACSGAAFLNTRYGWEYGVPSYILAAFVGYTRVDESQHHWRDVIAGCTLGVGFNYQFVTSRSTESTAGLSLNDQGTPVLSYRMHY